MALRLADSDVLIDYLNDHEPYASVIESMLRASELTASTVGMFEVYSGVRGDSAKQRARELFARLDVVPLSEAAALRAAELRQQLASTGVPLPMGDLLIAGVALTLGIPVLTRNVRHFNRVDGLAVESP